MSQRGNVPKVLFVDDEPIIVRLVQRAFVRSPWVTRVAANVDEARRILSLEKFSIVITDYRMPGPNGLDLLETVRAVQPWAVRVLVTGDAHIELERPGCSELAHHCLVKPWTIEELRGRLATWLAGVAGEH